jgi:hypothetical protein
MQFDKAFFHDFSHSAVLYMYYLVHSTVLFRVSPVNSTVLASVSKHTYNLDNGRGCCDSIVYFSCHQDLIFFVHIASHCLMLKVRHKICTQRVKLDEDTIYLNKKIVDLFMNSGRESLGSGLQ